MVFLHKKSIPSIRYYECKASVNANPFCDCAIVIRGCIFKEIDDERSLALHSTLLHLAKKIDSIASQISRLHSLDKPEINTLNSYCLEIHHCSFKSAGNKSCTEVTL